MSDDIELSDERFMVALVRQRRRVVGGIDLVVHDDDSVGNKDSGVTWGICSGEKEAWPDPEDHLWPDQFVFDGRVAPKYTKPHQQCPLDPRPKSELDGNGCFWKCRVHQASRHRPLPSREQTIAFYDQRIKELT